MFPTSKLGCLPTAFHLHHLPCFGKTEAECIKCGPWKSSFDPACTLAVSVYNLWVTGTQKMRRMEDRRGTSWSLDLKRGTESCSRGFQIAFLYCRFSPWERGQGSGTRWLPPEQLHFQLPHTLGVWVGFWLNIEIHGSEKFGNPWGWSNHLGVSFLNC